MGPARWSVTGYIKIPVGVLVEASTPALANALGSTLMAETTRRVLAGEVEANIASQPLIEWDSMEVVVDHVGHG